MCDYLRTTQRNPNSLPDDRVKLYSECIDFLLYKRDQERLILNSSNDYPALSITHIEALLQEYADHLMSNNLSEESSTDVEDFFDRHLPLMSLTDWTGRSLRDYFVARTGLLIEPSEGFTAFRHRTFQEFLSAKVIIRKNNIRMLLGKASYDEWRETIILAMGLPETDKKQCDLFVGGLLRKSKALKTKHLRSELLFLAVACLETATWLSADIRKEVIEDASKQMPPRNSDECRLIARAGEVAIDMLRYNPAHSYREMAYCIEAITSVGNERAMSAIEEYVKSEHYSRTDNSVFILHRAVGKAWLRFSGLRRARDTFGDIEILDLRAHMSGDTYLDRIRSS